MGARLMVQVLADPDRYPPRPQPSEGVTYAAKIDKAETRLDFTQSASQLERQVRAFQPTPGAWFEVQGERIKVLSAEPVDAMGTPGDVLDDALTIACGEGALRPLILQRAGRGVSSAQELLRGFAIPAGTRL